MAVYTPVSEAELKSFLAQYDVGALQAFYGITQGVENTNYLVETSKQRLILTLYEKRVHESDLPFFIGLMDHLARAGVSCPTPLRSRSGDHIGRLAGRPAAIVSFLDGTAIACPTSAACFNTGAAMARLHAAGRDYAVPRPNALGHKSWAPLYRKFQPDCGAIHAGLAGAIERELATADQHWPKDLPSGVIHADMFPDNVFFDSDGHVSGIIDFYFACHDSYAYDLAIGINAWCFDASDKFQPDKSAALVAGYESIRQLTRAECDALPILCRGAALRFLLTRAYDWLNTDEDAQVDLHDPLPFLRRLEAHRALGVPDAYGVTHQ